jgi:uncharacterized protein (DUF885 family)
MSSEECALRTLAEDFWVWREATQPDCYDDLSRVERPTGWLPDWSLEAITKRMQALHQFSARLRGISLSALPVPVRVDAELIGCALARVHWELHLLRSWERNPCFYLDQALLPIYQELLRPVTDESRAYAVASWLAQVPEVLAQGQVNLTKHAAISFADYALQLLDTADDALRVAIAAFAEPLSQPLITILHNATSAAARALAEFRKWLQKILPTLTYKFAPGREALRYFLHCVALLPFSIDELRDLAHREYTRTTALELTLIRRGEPTTPALQTNVAGQINLQRSGEQEVRSFLLKEGILDLPGHIRHYRNAPLPTRLEPLTWLGVQHYTAVLARPDQDALRYIPAPHAGLPYFQLAEARDPRVGVVHEGIHAWQLDLSSAHENPARRHYYDSAPNEGIAFHMEELSMVAGLFDNAPASRRFIVNAMRLRALRVEIDLSLALGELTLDQAASQLTQWVSMDRKTALEEAVFYASHPGLGVSYLVP